jgi:hypothetical protein
MARYFLAIRLQVDFHLSVTVKHMVNNYFKRRTTALRREIGVPLYLPAGYIQQARQTLAHLKAKAALAERDCKVLVIAPDTASAVTRPPLNLLTAALTRVLAASPHLIVSILPSYTEAARSHCLRAVLAQNYPRRVFLVPAEPRAHLLETAALIDQADIFVTGDTGVMHLAAAHKKLSKGDDARFVPSNTVKIIAIFGGTNPGYFGYSRRTIIVGRGRKEQTALRPGFSKESYNLQDRNLFDHLSAQQIADAILDADCS